MTLLLSEELVIDAHIVGEANGRTVAEQIEFWAGLGKEMDAIMRPKNVLAVNRNPSLKAFEDLIRQVDTPEGRQRLKEHLAKQPYPHYEAVSDRPHLLTRIEADGTRTTGQFARREFVAA